MAKFEIDVYNVHKHVAVEVGFLEAAFLQYCYNFVLYLERSGGKEYKIGDEFYFFHSIDSFRNDFPFLTNRQIEYLKNKLIKNGYLKTTFKGGARYKHTLYYTITDKTRALYTVSQNCDLSVSQNCCHINNIKKTINDIKKTKTRAETAPPDRTSSFSKKAKRGLAGLEKVKNKTSAKEVIERITNAELKKLLWEWYKTLCSNKKFISVKQLENEIDFIARQKKEAAAHIVKKATEKKSRVLDVKSCVAKKQKKVNYYDNSNCRACPNKFTALCRKCSVSPFPHFEMDKWLPKEEAVVKEKTSFERFEEQEREWLKKHGEK